MAYPNSKPLSSLAFANLLLFLLSRLSCVDAIYFNFSSFDTNSTDIILDWDASFYTSSIYLTKNPLNGPITHSAGRALYRGAVQLWEVNDSTTKLADFTTHFSFNISNVSKIDDDHGHGLAFFLIPEDANWHPNTSVGGGGLLGLFESEESALNDTRMNPLVAVEFDTLMNVWDPSGSHMGIDVNSIESRSYVNVSGGFMNRGTANALVTYNSTTNNLSASLTFTGSLMDSFSVYYIIDLSTVLPQRVRVGFTASTGVSVVETHQVYSWSFNSTMEEDIRSLPTPSKGRNKVSLVVGVVIGIIVAIILAIGVAIYWFSSSKNAPKPRQLVKVEVLAPKVFSYSELYEATAGFSEDLVLGRGGFGDVYKGNLANSNNEKVAIKKFRSGSTQGEKEYVSEVNIISSLRHKNLVQLKGWCHENRELLLVYELMENKSLDFHLFNENAPFLTWPKRYNIALGLASGLHYLQEGCNPYVIHRDIKSSNVMLDLDFNAKLGDFGLARLIEYGQSLRTTVLAGTLCYLAPECFDIGKASKKSDTYSFGVVSLELACGRKPSERLIEWAWDLYGRGCIREAVDRRLMNNIDSGEFDEDQARRLVVVGLWCCHPDPDHRPLIMQVLAALNFEAPEPSLPVVVPRIIYDSASTSTTYATAESEAGGLTTLMASTS